MYEGDEVLAAKFLALSRSMGHAGDHASSFCLKVQGMPRLLQHKNYDLMESSSNVQDGGPC